MRNNGNEKKQKNKKKTNKENRKTLGEKNEALCMRLDLIGFYTKSGFVSSYFYALLYGKYACWHYRSFLFRRVLLFVP